MAAVPLDLRNACCARGNSGVKANAVASTFDVSRAWVRSVGGRWRETGSITPRKQTRFRGRALSSDEEMRLVALITATPDATLAELQHALPTRRAEHAVADD